jgi:hypothetical protein
MYAPSLDPYIFSKATFLTPKWWSLARFKSFHGYLGFLSTQIYSLKNITPILFY